MRRVADTRKTLTAIYWRTQLMKTALAIAFLVLLGVTSVLHGQAPNVLFVLCDDLRPDALGCFGSAHVKTPNIDALASEGCVSQTRFVPPHCAHPVEPASSRAFTLTVTVSAITSPSCRPACHIGPPGCARAVTRRPTSASGIWVKTTIRRVQGSIGS